MIMRYFEWDARKAQSNERKHGITFEDAALIFDDPLHVSRQDRHEDGEERWQTVGMVNGVLMLLVAHTMNDVVDGELIRIISARRATKAEKAIYEHG